MRYLFVALLGCWLFTASRVNAQTYIKANAALAPLGIINVGMEAGIGKRMSFQFDALVSPWRSYGGDPLVLCMVFPEVRYFLMKEAMNGLYVGGHAGFGMFRMRKWNYTGPKWGNYYQVGWNGMFGASIGYQWRFKERWVLDGFIGGGWQHATYEGFDETTGEQYVPLNWSSEWLPYRGGLMIGYRL